jgi:hypothetical protein
MNIYVVISHTAEPDSQTFGLKAYDDKRVAEAFLQGCYEGQQAHGDPGLYFDLLEVPFCRLNSPGEEAPPPPP